MQYFNFYPPVLSLIIKSKKTVDLISISSQDLCEENDLRLWNIKRNGKRLKQRTPYDDQYLSTEKFRSLWQEQGDIKQGRYLPPEENRSVKRL